MNSEDKDVKRMTVVIAGRSYPVKVTSDEARVLPSIEKNLNDEVRKVQLSYKNLDMQDCLSMVLLKSSLDSTDQSSASTEVTDLESKIDRLNDIISQSL